MATETSNSGGRPRDASLDTAIIAATLRLLNERGFEALTVAGVAERAGTTRPAVYRRFHSKTALAITALASLSKTTSPALTGDHHADLVAELTAFRDAITDARSISLVGSLLLETLDAAVKDAYRNTVVRPRRERIGRILSAARDDGLLAGSSADQDLAVNMCTGSWYALAVAGTPPPPDWPRKTADLIWQALGGG